MLYEIKNRFTGSVLFSLETESFKLCVEAAVKARANLADANLADANLARAYLADAYLARAYLAGADLDGANLAGADLTGANLAGANLADANLADAYLARAYLADAYLARAYLAGADLDGANLAGAKIRDGITVTKAPIQISGLFWRITIWDAHMQIGCEFHSHDEWRNFSDEEWLRMGGKKALYLKREQFPMLIALCDQHKPKATQEVA